MNRYRYRMLRGMVFHVLRKRRDARPGQDNATNRTPAAGITHSGRWGRCTWCRLTLEPAKTGRPRKWHPSCYQAYLLAAGGATNTKYAWNLRYKWDYGDRLRLIERVSCLCGARVSELDHMLAIGVAQRLAAHVGRKIYVLAFLRENLRWLCYDCHRVKTRFDRAWMKNLDNPNPIPSAHQTPTPTKRQRMLLAGQLPFRMDSNLAEPGDHG